MRNKRRGYAEEFSICMIVLFILLVGFAFGINMGRAIENKDTEISKAKPIMVEQKVYVCKEQILNDK